MKEMAFISYYFHWSEDEVLGLDHKMRRKWCHEISSIHKSLNPSDQKKERNIFEIS